MSTNVGRQEVNDGFDMAEIDQERFDGGASG